MVHRAVRRVISINGLPILALVVACAGTASAQTSGPVTLTSGGPSGLLTPISLSVTAGTTGDKLFDYVYDKTTGDLKIQYDGDPAVTAATPLATLKIQSAGGLINDVVAGQHRPAGVSVPFSQTSPTVINWTFLQQSDGTFADGFDFGNILPPSLSAAAVQNDLSLFYARSTGAQNQTTADLVVVASPSPEPTSLALVAVAAGGLMARRRRRQAPSQR